ncbi:hypothetical protein B296_00003672 [Ensete ventricosum]|uniref:aldehyde oxygenase (deformylating) n=1 Tax=Ensete ventricosum TaxID=4639 RepID=A0A427B9Z4_ENSVE|nr:hypothetical protein B296_00003672 [Ensete ventricosum]
MSLQYLLYGPIIAKVIYSRPWAEESKEERWCVHLLILFALRGLTYQLWYSFSNMLFLVRRRRIIKDGVDFKQIDQEWHWYARMADSDNFLILHCMIGAVACLIFPSLQSLPRWDLRGLFIALLLHVVFSEPVFYCMHRVLHRPHLYKNYHALHHSSQVPQSFTGNTARISSPLSDNPCIDELQADDFCSAFSWICHAFGAPHPVCGNGSPSSRSLLGWTWRCWAHIWLRVAV